MNNSELMFMVRMLQAHSAWQIGNPDLGKEEQNFGSEQIFAELLQTLLQAQSDATTQSKGQQLLAKSQSFGFGLNDKQPRTEKLSLEQLITASSQKYGVNRDLIRQVIQAESGYNPKALSPVGAEGLMQLMPATAASYGVTNSFDPAQNIDAGTHLLQDLLERYQGNVPLALAAYNAGPGAVEKYQGIPPYQETQNYVHKITAQLNKIDRKA